MIIAKHTSCIYTAFDLFIKVVDRFTGVFILLSIYDILIIHKIIKSMPTN